MDDDERSILLADDDPEDREMIRKALESSLHTGSFFTVQDGEDLLDYLHHRGRHAPASASPTPGIILLDLNMPKMDGREALVAIRANPELRRIPIVVMTTSKDTEDIARTYDLGANSFINKPSSQSKLADVMAVLADYWFDVVRLPDDEKN